MTPVAKTSTDSNGRHAFYIFKHALTHEVSYESLLLARRKELHRFAAEAIQQLFPNELEEHAAILGRHYAKADLSAAASEHLTRAGERAARLYANEEAISFYQQAIEQVRRTNNNPEARAAELKERVGDLLVLIGRVSDARDHYHEASLGTDADVTRSGRLARKIAKTYEIERNFPEAFSHYRRAEEILEKKPEPERDKAQWEELIETRLQRSWAHYFSSDGAMARELETLTPIVANHGNSRQRGDLVDRTVLMRFQHERFCPSDQTLALAREVVRLRRDEGNLLSLGHATFMLGLTLVCHNDIAEAEEQLNTAREIGERTGDLVLLSRSLNYITFAHRRRQDVSRAERAVKRLLPVATRGAIKDYLGMVKATFGWIAWCKGDHVTARGEAEAALELWSTSTVWPFKWNALWPLIGVALEAKRLEAAAAYARQLLEPGQQPLPDVLQESLNAFLAAIDLSRNDEALELARRMVCAAQACKYL
jgi:tetratricopeptide (TPR) repeat protein